MDPHSLSSGSHTPHVTHTVTQDSLPYACGLNMASSNASALVEMLSKIDTLDVIPKLQVATYSHVTGQEMGVVSETVAEVTPPIQQESSSLLPVTMVEVPRTIVTISDSTPTIIPSNPSISDVLSSLMRQASEQDVSVQSPDDSGKPDKKRPRVGRPRIKPQKEKADWHYHLGGVRQARNPLSPELREVLEVAYVSKIMSKNFRKEGQPEKERIANITGMDLDKVQEWFKNRRKKDKLQKERHHSSGKPGSKSSNKLTVEPASLQTTPTVEVHTSAVGSELTPTSCELELYA